jgi:hypothetical protein
MSDINDGGQAFPYIQWKTADGLFVSAKSSGMSLRDYFAAQALSAITILDRVPGDPKHDDYYDSVAEYAYSVADAMLKARGE